MIGSVFQAILDKLNDDSVLKGYLGTWPFAFRARMEAPSQIPSITLMENSEKSKSRVGYATTAKIRDNYPTIQVEVWVSSAD